jgi:hypothetical protein
VAGARGVGIDAVLVDRRGRYDPPPDGVPVVTSLEGLLPLIDARLA